MIVFADDLALLCSLPDRQLRKSDSMKKCPLPSLTAGQAAQKDTVRTYNVIHELTAGQAAQKVFAEAMEIPETLTAGQAAQKGQQDRHAERPMLTAGQAAQKM